MGIERENGYSASVEGFLLVGGARFRLAKTNGVDFVLAEPCELPPGSSAEMEIVVDGHSDVKRITLPDGVVAGQKRARYQDAVPF